jgi:proteasome alpha subunit
MLSPYDWQEGIGHRAQYVESRLAGGSPVVAASFEEGIVMVAYRKSARKLFEVYDELAMGAIGQQSDVESLRQAGVDFAHQEGFSRSERDVTIHRVVNALSGPIKRAFADFSMVPVVARAIFAQIGQTPAQDGYAMLDYDGDFHVRHQYGYVAPSAESAEVIDRQLSGLKREKVKIPAAIEQLKAIWKEGFKVEMPDLPPEQLEALSQEVAILERRPTGEVRFRYETDYVE